jgi:hypothetical protein
MIKRAVAFTDSVGAFHPSRDAACKAEFERALRAHFGTAVVHEAINVTDLVEALHDLDKMIGEACKEDTTVEYAPKNGALS